MNGIEADKGAAEREVVRGRSGLVGLPRLERGDARARGGRLVPRAVPARLRGQALPRAPRLRAGCAGPVRRACATGSTAPASRPRSPALGTADGQGHAARRGRRVGGRARRRRRAQSSRRAREERRVRAPGEAGRAAIAFDAARRAGPHGARARRRAPGIVAATRFEEQQPTWVVSGTDAAGLDRAVALVDRAALRDRFAVAAAGAPSRSRCPVRRARRDDADRPRIPRHGVAAARDPRGRGGRVHARAVRRGARHAASADARRRARVRGRAGLAAGVGAELRSAARLAVPLALLVAAINPLVSREGLTLLVQGPGRCRSTGRST